MSVVSGECTEQPGEDGGGGPRQRFSLDTWRVCGNVLRRGRRGRRSVDVSWSFDTGHFRIFRWTGSKSLLNLGKRVNFVFTVFFKMYRCEFQNPKIDCSRFPENRPGKTKANRKHGRERMVVVWTKSEGVSSRTYGCILTLLRL